jgi:prepilin-type N-terminal cleavage/methylation domain-containing protein
MTQPRLTVGTEDGFTLVEVVMAIAIVGLVAVALAGVILAVFRNSGGAASAATNARDKELVGIYFTRDVESALLVEPTTTEMQCVGALAPNMHGLAEIDVPNGFVDYYWVDGSTTAVLYRTTCSQPPSSTSASPLVRALNVHCARRPRRICQPPTVTCTASCTGPNSSATLTFWVLGEADQYQLTTSMRASPPVSNQSND